MKTAILGSGFGLYGYLPALVACGADVVLPRRYQDTVLARAELAGYFGKIEWREDSALLQGCEAVIIAVPPTEQPDLVKDCLRHDSITHLWLEKPLAANHFESSSLLNLLESSGRKFRIGYNFRFTGWGQVLLAQGGGADTIVWRFKAHHFAHGKTTWKRDPVQGGGVLRFYGIHLIALLAELGYDSVTQNSLTGEAAQWQAEFAGPGLRDCQITVDSNDDDSPELTVYAGDDNICLPDPFCDDAESTGADQRIPYLVKGLTGWLMETERFYPWYRQTNSLWQKIEDQLAS